MASLSISISPPSRTRPCAAQWRAASCLVDRHPASNLRGSRPISSQERRQTGMFYTLHAGTVSAIPLCSDRCRSVTLLVPARDLLRRSAPPSPNGTASREVPPPAVCSRWRGVAIPTPNLHRSLRRLASTNGSPAKTFPARSSRSQGQQAVSPCTSRFRCAVAQRFARALVCFRVGRFRLD